MATIATSSHSRDPFKRCSDLCDVVPRIKEYRSFCWMLKQFRDLPRSAIFDFLLLRAHAGWLFKAFAIKAGW